MKSLKKAFKSSATAVKDMPMLLPTKKMNNSAVVGKRIRLLTKDGGLQNTYNYSKKGIRVDKNKAKKTIDKYSYGSYSSHISLITDF